MAKDKPYQAELEKFFRGGTKLSYKKGEIIIRPEDTPQGVFYIEKGFLKSYAITKYGEENLLIIRKAGEMFPVIWTFIDERSDVFYEAMSDIDLYRVDRRAYLDLVQKDMPLAMGVLGQVVEMYRIHSERVNNLEYRSAAERVAYRLLTLAIRFGTKTEEGTKIDAPIRHHDIAASVNCSRETASRELSKLEKRGFILSIKGKIIIKDKDGLRSKIEQKSRIQRLHIPMPKIK